MLTLQIIRLMDKIWLRSGLDLKVVTYQVLATGPEHGECGEEGIMHSALPVSVCWNGVETLKWQMTELCVCVCVYRDGGDSD